MEHSDTFGELIRRLRGERRWTQERLAREAGITITCLSNLERGATKDPNTETIVGLAVAFGLDPSELDPRRLAVVVAEKARSFEQRQAIMRLLALGDRDIEAVLDFLDQTPRGRKKRR
jgi:transcriptional regulator with XRE-family HTH domain